MWFTTLLSGLVSVFTGSVQGWQDRETARVQNEVAIERARAEAEVTRLNKIAEADINWDYEALRQADRSWKDEYWTIILSIPMVLIFVPGMEVHIQHGFKNLEAVPEWYRYAVGTAIAAAFGFRKLTELVGKFKK